MVERMSDAPGDTNGSPATSENYEELKRALSELADAVTGDPGANETGWLKRVQSAARSLFGALEEHEDVSEEEGGTLPAMTGQKPALMAERKRLEREHIDMLHRAEEIEEEIERQLSFEDFNIELVRLEGTILRDILQLHLLRTDTLMYEAFFRVEGGEEG
jgi:hypothetical protein